MKTPRLRLDRVRKSYAGANGRAEVTAIEEISLEVWPGEFVSLVGPSGCGKSTLLHIIGGFEPVSGGAIYLDERAVDRPGADRGMVFQEYGLFPWLTVQGNVEFGLRNRSVPEKERGRIARHFIGLVGLAGFESSYPHQLSGGMKQRCALARCFANDPEVMLMDEPLAAVDALTRMQLQDELLRIWGESQADAKTVLYVTHAIEEALYLSDRVVVMTARPGRIKEVLPVPFGRPRRPELRLTPDFHALADRVWLSLQEEARGG